jgi:Ca2+-binding EF-hand superfamily protein
MFDKYDEDGSGTIDFNEFAELITSFNRERYTKVFQSFDVDGSGELDADEVCKQCGVSLTAHELHVHVLPSKLPRELRHDWFHL